MASHFFAGAAQDRSWLMQFLTISLNLGVWNTCGSEGKCGRRQGLVGMQLQKHTDADAVLDHLPELGALEHL
jgi:hypothetical protein